jgi:hypothetical protein
MIELIVGAFAVWWFGGLVLIALLAMGVSAWEALAQFGLQLGHSIPEPVKQWWREYNGRPRR